jgi:PAS domain S-box-containing protein
MQEILFWSLFQLFYVPGSYLSMTNQASVLLVDESKAISVNMRAILESLGHDVIEFENEREAINMLEGQKPDLILIGLKFPESDGYATIAEFKYKKPQVPIIVMSQHETAHAITEAMRFGACDYLLWPVQKEFEIEMLLKRTLERGRLQHDNHRYHQHLQELVQAYSNDVRESKDRYKRLLSSLTSYIYTVNINKDGSMETLHRSGCERLTGYSVNDYNSNSSLWFRTIHEDDRQKVLQVIERVLVEPGHQSVEHRICHKNGSIRWVTNTLVPCHVSGVLISYDGIISDITERKNAEQALIASEAKLRMQFERMPIGCIVLDSKMRVTSWNPAAEQIFGFREEEMLGKSIYKKITPAEDWSAISKSLLSGDAVSKSENVNFTKDGRRIHCAWTNSPFFDSNDMFNGMLSMCQDISERKKSEEQLKLHMDNLAALSTIDEAINSSLDLRITLKVLLHETLKQLKVDASCVLLLDPYSQLLEYKAGIGFSSNRISFAKVRFGESYAGKVAKDRRSLIIRQIDGEENSVCPIRLLDSEGFSAYCGVPLIAKGQVKGVLEIFNRQPLDPDEEWLGFVEAFANQAAIAIDNAEMYDNLQSSHSELLLAYDTTIEGWSRALDYRDKETDGHSRRVTDMTVRIAREMGIARDKLIHIRRGALLHDIGKLGVPDNILLKPDKLTDEEFNIMKKHTEIAFSVLSPIEFLRPAMDIPYYHHEKWDGSGYPRGLKGEEIPLVARIFAFVDVWDALLSDRPYRPAWPLERVKEYIRSHAGTHFDPGLIEIIERILFTDYDKFD